MSAATGGRTCVCVTGMHRSGTSIAARLAQLLGVSLGDPGDLLAPGRDNPAGYWENRTIKELDDEVLAHCGGSWDQPPVLEPGWELAADLEPFRTRAAAALAASFADVPPATLIGWKDPRLALLLPFWQTVTPIATTIVVVRDPAEVAASLRSRNGIDSAQAALLWLRYLYAATAAGPPYLLVRLDDVFDDLAGTLGAIAAHLGLPRPDDALLADARAHLDPGLRHHVAPVPAENPLVALARDVWADGAVHLDAVAPLVGDALAQGWLRPPIDAEALARARAQVVTLRETVRRRAAQRARKEAREQGRHEGRVMSGPALAVSETWVLDGASHERLLQQLASLPLDVAGVAAATGPLPPGASFRVEAEHRTDEPLDVATEPVRGPVRAAVVRPGITVTVGPDGVDAGDHELLLDPGAHVHDPWAGPGDLAPASPRGRPPFPWRPVVVFLGSEADAERAEWARALVNGLVRNDVEARLALPAVAEGLHLTRPCLPDEASLRTLAPDVVVALDAGAVELAGAAAGVNRSLVLVEPIEDVAASWELVSWRRGHTSGRLRARIGPRVDPATLAGLVRRLCAGPHPLTLAEATGGPVRTWTPGVERRDPRWSRSPVRTLAIVTAERSPGARVEGLVEHLSACGVDIELVTLGKRDDPVQAADLVLLDRRARSDDAAALVAALGTRVVVDLGPHDLTGDGPPVEATLSPAAAALVRAAGGAIAAAPALHRAARDAGARSIVVPTLLPRARALALRRVRSRHERSTAPVLAWAIGARARRPVVAAAAAALLELLESYPELHLEVHGRRDDAPRDLLTHRRATVVVDPDAEQLAAWRAQLWTPGAVDADIASDLLPLVDASCAAVPTVVAARLRPSIEGPYPRDLLVADEKASAEWANRLRPLLDDQDVWAQRSAAVARHADTLAGPAAGETVANRFLGWAARGAP